MYETIAGITTIRAFRHVQRFVERNERYVSEWARAEYASQATSQWLNFRLQMISVLMIAVVGLTAVFEHMSGAVK